MMTLNGNGNGIVCEDIVSYLQWYSDVWMAGARYIYKM